MCPTPCAAAPGNPTHALRRLSLPRPRDQRRPALEATLAAAAPALLARDLLPLTVRRERSRAIHRLASYFGETEGDLSALVVSALQQRRFAQAPGARLPSGRLSKRPSRFTRRLMEPGLRRFAYPRRQPYVGRPFAPWPGLGCGLGMKRVGVEGYGAWRAMPAAGEGAFALRVLGALPKPVEGLASLRWLHENGAREQEAWRLAALSVTPGGEVARYDYGRGRCRRAPKVATVRARLALPRGASWGGWKGPPYALAPFGAGIGRTAFPPGCSI